MIRQALGRTYINLGASNTYKNKIYASGMTNDSTVKSKIEKLQTGQKISIIGIAFKSGSQEESSWPITLNDIQIITE